MLSRDALASACRGSAAPATADGYTTFTGVVLHPLGASNVSGTLGAAEGDDEHCRRVCDLVPGCGAITRLSRASDRCLLHKLCAPLHAASTTHRHPWPQAATACTADGSTSLADSCRPGLDSPDLPLAERQRSQPEWRRLAYRLPIEGDHLGVVAALNVQQCRDACDLLPGCNSFARVKRHITSGDVMCHLKAHCAMPGSKETLLDAAAATPTMRNQLVRLQGRFHSHYRWPCSQEEILYPLPGRRRTFPLTIGSGLSSFDCSLPSVGGSVRGRRGLLRAAPPRPAAFVFAGSDDPVRAVRSRAARARTLR